MTSSRPAIAIVGGGPRGVLLLDRMVANLGELGPRPLDVHIIDDTQIGAGRVWRTDQTRELCMNTLADAVTLFTDESVTMAGPVRQGPTMYEWCQLALSHGMPDAVPTDEVRRRIGGVDPGRVRVFESHPVREGFVEEYRDELEAQRPESHPSRPLYGEYIRWCWGRAVAAAPNDVRVHEHTDRVTGVSERGGRQVLSLRSGERIEADAVVAATGWLHSAPPWHEAELADAVAASPALVWVRQGSPVDQNLVEVPDGSDAIVRGVGMGFFDAMALLTVERGGRFVADGEMPWGLRYEPSGREPRLLVTSNRGVPYRAKTLYGSLPPKAELRYARSVDWSAHPRPIDFDRELWPLIAKDAYCAHGTTLHRVKPGAIDLDGALAAIDGVDIAAGSGHPDAGDPARSPIVTALGEAVAPFVPDPDDRLDLGAVISPGHDIRFSGPDEFDEWATRFVADDLREAERGADSPVKAALWTVASARGVAYRAGAFGGFDAESRWGGQARFQAIGNHAGSGPPAFRNRQLLALHEAGLVRFIGPAAGIEADADGFRATSAVTGADVTAPVLIDALMRFHDVGRSADPLIRSLNDAGRIRPFEVSSRDGDDVATGGVDIDPGTGRLIRADGTVDRAFHIAGIPVDETMHDAIISPMPGADATMLRETDRVARSLLRSARGG